MQVRDLLEQRFKTNENGHFRKFHDICMHCAKTGLQSTELQLYVSNVLIVVNIPLFKL